jgi:hypothetical protein
MKAFDRSLMVYFLACSAGWFVAGWQLSWWRSPFLVVFSTICFGITVHARDNSRDPQ